ncbi:unnamed protein product [Prunus armeniaca]
MENLGRTEACEGISNEVPMTGHQAICLEQTGRVEEMTGRQAICLEPTGCVEGDDRLHSSMRDDCMEMTGHQVICLEPTNRPECNDRSPVEFFDEIFSSPEERDSDTGDSCEDEINIRPSFALPLLQPTRDNDEVLSNDVSTYPLPPRTTRGKPKDALSNPKWVDAMHVEMEALNKNATWELVPLPKWEKVGSKSYTQTYGVDYMEAFAPVAKLNTVRVLLSLAANHDWHLLQFDVKNTFLHGDLKEEINMDPQPGIPVTSKGSPRAWFERFAASIRKFGYVQSNSNNTLFLKRRKETGMLDCKPIDTPSEQNHKLGLYPEIKFLLIRSAINGL